MAGGSLVISLRGFPDYLATANSVWLNLTPETIGWCDETQAIETVRWHTIEMHDKDLIAVQLIIKKRLNISNCWTPESEEWKAAAEKVSMWQFQCCLNSLEGLMVVRMFELMRMNMSQTGKLICFDCPFTYVLLLSGYCTISNCSAWPVTCDHCAEILLRQRPVWCVILANFRRTKFSAGYAQAWVLSEYFVTAGQGQCDLWLSPISAPSKGACDPWRAEQFEMVQYFLRKHIGNALKSQSVAIHTTLVKYNAAAANLHPPWQ